MPEAVTPPAGARVMDLQDPTSKMSKSADSDAGLHQHARRPGDDRCASSSGPSPTPRTRCATTRPPSRASATCSRSSARPPARRPPTLAEGYTQYGPLKSDAGEAVVELLDADPGALPRAARRPGRARAAAAHRGGQGPRRRLGDARAGLRRRSACCRLESTPAHGSSRRSVPGARRSADRRAGGPGARQPRRRAALRARRHGDRRAPRHRPARRAGRSPPPCSSLVVAGSQLPHLRHDRAGRPPPRRRRSAGAPPTSACRRCGCRSLVGVPSAPLVARRRRRPLCRLLGGVGDVLDFAVDLPADRRRRRARSSSSRSAPRACSAGRRRLPHAARRSCSSSNLVNAVLEIVFVFGFDSGVPGSAWSTVIAQVGAGGRVRCRRPPPPAPGRRHAGRAGPGWRRC